MKRKLHQLTLVTIKQYKTKEYTKRDKEKQPRKAERCIVLVHNIEYYTIPY